MTEPTRMEARGRRNTGRVYLVTNAVLLLAIAFMVNYLAYRHYTRWDWTDEARYTLSDRSERVVRGLSSPVTVYVLLSRNEPEQAEVRNLLTRYRALSSRLEVRYVDPYEDPGGYDRVVRRFHLADAPDEMQQDEGVVPLSDVAVVVASGERHWELRRDDLVRHNYGEETGDLVELDVEAERAITGAIVEVIHGEPTRLCFAGGHGERALEGSAGSLSGLVDELRHENIESEALELRGLREIPLRSPNGSAGCDAVFVVDPQLQFDEGSIELLRSYLRRGGNVLMAFEPMPRGDEVAVLATGFEDMLGDLGVRVGRDLAVELDTELIPANGGHPVLLFLVAEFGEHPLTERIRTLRPELRAVAVARGARSITPANERAQTLLQTSAASYGETDLESGEVGVPGADDTRGPLSLGVATQMEQGDGEGEEPRGGRVVVLGDADLFSSALMQTTNADFVRALVGWLTQREALISISRRTIERPAVPTQGEEGMLFVRVVVLIPLAFVFLGVAVWWNRRR